MSDETDETLAMVLNRARDGRPYQLIHARMRDAGTDVSYQAVRAWFAGRSMPSLHHAGPLFDALSMSDEDRARAIYAAMREA